MQLTINIAGILSIYRGLNDYANYFYNVSSLYDFLNTTIAQDHLSYQKISDLYYAALGADVIVESDSTDIVAGMIYVSWTLGVGSSSNSGTQPGTGAWAWRYFNIGNGASSFNSGRYSATALST
jgi:hypothetical protein